MKFVSTNIVVQDVTQTTIANLLKPVLLMDHVLVQKDISKPHQVAKILMSAKEAMFVQLLCAVKTSLEVTLANVHLEQLVMQSVDVHHLMNAEMTYNVPTI